MSEAFEKVILVYRQSRLMELISRFNTEGQAKFYLESVGQDFAEYKAEDLIYRKALDHIQQDLEEVSDRPVQRVERSYVPNMIFTDQDLVLAVGQDGLVANTAKYLQGRPLIGVNPDPTRYDGILLPFAPGQVKTVIENMMKGQWRSKKVTMAQALLNDGQSLLAFNDLFIGPSSHVSARYLLRIRGEEELQSSSGVIVSTGAGSTGWMSSLFNMVQGFTSAYGGQARPGVAIPWSDPRLLYAVREPFKSRQSDVRLIAGYLQAGEELIIESRMASGAVIFSDGMEADRLQFDAGRCVSIKAAPIQAELVVPD